jgi:undecaprenyl-diphosphatase
MLPESASVLARLSDYDARLCVHCNRFARRAAVRRFFATISRLGDGMFWYALMGWLLLTRQDAAIVPVLHMIAVGMVGLLLYKWLKKKALRPRPCALHPAIVRGTAPLDEFSFPSGHTLHAVGFSVVVLAYFPPLAPLVLPFALLVALSRIVLGLHYASDVLAGAAIGYGLAAASFLLT